MSFGVGIIGCGLIGQKTGQVFGGRAIDRLRGYQ